MKKQPFVFVSLFAVAGAAAVAALQAQQPPAGQAAGQRAQRRPCRIEAKPLAEADEWLENYRRIWEANFQRLDDLLDEMKAEEKKPNPPKAPRN